MLEELKRILRIDAEDEDERLNEIIKRSAHHVQSLVGKPITDTPSGIIKNLILNRARYEFNNAVELFAENFANEILLAQLEVATNED